MSDDRVRRLTELLDSQLGTPCEQIRHQQELEAQRNQIIEECARVVDDLMGKDDGGDGYAELKYAAAAIRALKDKP